MRRHRLPTRSTRWHLALRSAGALLVLSSVTLAWGLQSQDSEPEPADSVAEQVADPYGGPLRGPVAGLVGGPTSGPGAGPGKGPRGGPNGPGAGPGNGAGAGPFAQPTQPGAQPAQGPTAGPWSFPGNAPGPTPLPSEEPSFPSALDADPRSNPLLGSVPTTRPPAQNATPAHVIEFLFQDMHALGELVFWSYSSGYSIEIVELERSDAGGRGRIVVRETTAPDPVTARHRARPPVLDPGVPGVEWISQRTVDPKNTPSGNPLGERVHALQKELDDLASQIERISAARESLERALDAKNSELRSLGLQPAPARDPRGVSDPPGEREIRGAILQIKDNVHVFNRGRKNGVVQGMMFDIFSGSTYKGRARVIQTRDDLSLGVLELQVEPVEPGDQFTTRL